MLHRVFVPFDGVGGLFQQRAGIAAHRIWWGTTGSCVPCAMNTGVFALAGAASCAKLSASGR
jgi:hypothetical protein